MEKLEDNEIELLKSLLGKKIENIEWVIEHKQPENLDSLEAKKELMQKILGKL